MTPSRLFNPPPHISASVSITEIFDGTEETSSGVSEMESLQESIIEDLSTDPTLKPKIATGRRRIGGTSSLLDDYQDGGYHEA